MTDSHRPPAPPAVPPPGADPARVAELARLAARYRPLVEASAQIVWHTTPDGCCVEPQPTWAAYTGQSYDEYRGAGWLAAVHPDDRAPTLAAWDAARAACAPYEVELRLRRHDGVYRRFVARAVPVLEDGAATVREWVGTLADVTERWRAQRDSAFLIEAADVLGSSLDYDATLAAVAQLVVPTLADWCAVDVLEPGGTVRRIALAAADGGDAATSDAATSDDVAARRRTPPTVDDPAGGGAVLRTGTPELVPDAATLPADAHAPEAPRLALMQTLGIASYLAVPLEMRTRRLGALTMAQIGSGRRFSESDLRLATELARRVAMAAENAELFRNAATAVARTERLQRVTAALASAITPTQVASAVLEQGVRPLGGLMGLLGVLADDGHTVELAGTVDVPARVAARWQRFALSAELPMADAMRRGEPVWAESVDALVARYPAMRSVRAALGVGAALAVPLVVDGRAVGAVSVWFREAVPIGEHDRTYLETVARLGAQALERARLYARAEAARREAEEANLAKTQFLATMSHELRTPLNAVIGHTDLLAMGLHGPVVPAQLEALVRVRKGGQFLLSMINDILNFARLESGRVELELADLPVADLLSDAEALVAPQFLSKGLSFAQRVIYRGPGCDRLAVRTDAEKTRQVLVNLLTNALKFTSAGGVTLECTLASSDTVAITVRDTGRGIPRAKLASIFEPFVQVDRHLTEGSQQGVGLGLSISRDLARLMGGDLTVESVVGVGSRFTLTLPRAPHAEASAAADERRQGAERRTDDRRTGLDRRHEGELRA